MKEESPEMHLDGDKNLLEKNRKRTVKTRAQIEALEKFYDEHKYPTETMKAEVAESIGLTEKQVSGWFCHRRLKDKKLNVTGKQDRSSGVVQDGHKQDSCGSTKQGDDRNIDTREVESGPDLTYEHGGHYAENYNNVNNPSSGSSSSLRNMSNHQNVDPLDAPTSSYMVPKFTAVKRSGPSGYLKVKGRIENPAITAVKKQLGEHYREDGPPLGIEFDPLPPGAFKSSMHDTVEEMYYSGEATPPASDDVTKTHLNPKFGNAYEYKSSPTSYTPNIDRNNHNMRRGCDIPDGYVHQRFRPRTSFPDYPRRNPSIELPEFPDQDGYRMKPRPGVEVSRLDSVPSHLRTQPYNGIVKEEPEESWRHKYNNANARAPVREKIKNEHPNSTIKRKRFRNCGDWGESGRVIKDGKMYSDRRIMDDNRVKIPFNYDCPAPKRTKEEYTPLAFDNPPPTYRGIRSLAMPQVPSSFGEEEESAETSSSVD